MYCLPPPCITPAPPPVSPSRSCSVCVSGMLSCAEMLPRVWPSRVTRVVAVLNSVSLPRFARIRPRMAVNPRGSVAFSSSWTSKQHACKHFCLCVCVCGSSRACDHVRDGAACFPAVIIVVAHVHAWTVLVLCLAWRTVPTLSGPSASLAQRVSRLFSAAFPPAEFWHLCLSSADARLYGATPQLCMCVLMFWERA